jgi:phospholipid-binding lipoprotein MlaA
MKSGLLRRGLHIAALCAAGLACASDPAQAPAEIRPEASATQGEPVPPDDSAVSAEAKAEGAQKGSGDPPEGQPERRRNRQASYPPMFQAIAGPRTALRPRPSVTSTRPSVQTGPILSPEPVTSESDPIEPVNRAFFIFNDVFDRGFLEPIAIGWSYATPQFFRKGLDKVFTNLRFPVRFVGNLLQAEVVHAGEEFARFGVNSTVGVAGFFDPASSLGLGFYDEDFGQALGVYGVPNGPYVMIPLMGPSVLRDTFALVLDAPLGSATGLGGAGVLYAINTRAIYIDDVRAARAASLDYYVFVRNAYIQRRTALIRNEVVYGQEQIDDSLYEIDGQ